MVFVLVSVDANETVEEPMQGLTPGDDGVGVESLVCLGEGIEEAPGIAGCELVVRRGSPFLQYPGDLGGGDGPAIDRLDDEIVGLRVGQGPVLIGLDALIKTSETVSELSDGSRREMTEIPNGIASVLPADLHFPGEGHVVATEDVSPGDKTRREGFIVAVAQPDNPLVVLDRTIGKTDLEDTEVSVALVTEGMALGLEGEPGGFQLSLDFGDEVHVGQRIPGFGGTRGGRREDVLPGDGFRAAVKKQSPAGGAALGSFESRWVHFHDLNRWVGYTGEAGLPCGRTGLVLLLGWVGMVSVPGPALLEVVAVSAVESRRRHVVLCRDSSHVTPHHRHEPAPLVGGHRAQRGDDELGRLRFDEVVQFQAALGVAGGLPVEHGVAGELHLVEVGRLSRIRGAGRGLEIHDPSALSHQVDDSLEGRKARGLEVAFDDDLDGLGFLSQGDGRLLEVVLEHGPRLLPQLFLLAVPVDAFLGLILRPVLKEHGMERLDVRGFAAPAPQVPVPQDLVDDLSDEESGTGGRGEALDIAEEELKPTGLPGLETRGGQVVQGTGLTVMRHERRSQGGRTHRRPPLPLPFPFRLLAFLPQDSSNSLMSPEACNLLSCLTPTPKRSRAVCSTSSRSS